ncbi:MAG: hypothetical protein GY855_14825 [candidate division Zixibacteria bacterium]|nr:hypothetical protein [candidate division Zixibacteria bacterium]
MKNILLIIVLLSIALGVCGSSKAENIDRIVAVVDNQIILFSEFLSQYQLLNSQGALEGMTSEEQNNMKTDLMEKMIDDKLLLIIARDDTTINVTTAEIKDALEEHIQNVRSRFPSEESFLTQLAEEGLTIKELRQRYRDEVENQIYKERLLGRQLSVTSINNQEVKEFFEMYRDSLPERPASVKIAHILFYIKPGEVTLSLQQARADSLHVRLMEGADFSELASKFSEDMTASKGGDLGFFGPGDMVAEFEKAAYALTPGQISDVVQTSYGYHIIKLEERDGERIRARHILFTTVSSSEDSAAVFAKADSIYQSIVDGMPFNQAAVEYSEDEESKVFEGDLGWYSLEDLTPEFKEAIADNEAGTILTPILSESGMHILKIEDRQPERQVSFELDKDQLRDMAKRHKANEKLQERIKKARLHHHVDQRDVLG